jgi:ribonuclease R
MSRSERPPNTLRQDILRALREPKGRAMHVMEICAKLDLPAGVKDDVRRQLDMLAEERVVQELPGLRYRALAAQPREAAAERPASERRISESPAQRRAPTARVGNLRIHPRGHGFVQCEDGSPDVFIAASELLGALHGDRVAVSVRRGDRGFEGTIVAVLQRNMRYVAGPMAQGPRGLYLTSNDARLPPIVEIVGDVPGDAVPGLTVVAEITRYSDDGTPPQAQVVRVLGVDGSADVEVAKIKLREGILEEFPEDVLAEARAYGDRVSQKDRREREDLRSIPFVTIDPVTARDHDDAIFIDRLDTGGYRVAVAIADVSHYVREGTALDTEARARSTSIYLPDRAIPMLPPELSSNLASLIAAKDRLALVLDMELGPNGAVRRFRYAEATIRCKAGLTYEGVARALGLSETNRHEAQAVRLLPMLEILQECAMILRNRRMKRGSLDFDLPEPSVELDPKTLEPRSIERSRRDPGVRRAYQLVEEMMLLANETVAADLGMQRLPAIYRVHGPPDESRLEQFAALAKAMGHHFDPEHVTSPKELSQFLRGLEDSPQKSALSYLLLRAMQQASYDTVNIGHFGLAAEHYLHFTSPIRRYPDLAVHRIVRKLARGEPIDAEGMELKLREYAGQSSKLERRAMQVEREVIDVYRCLLVRERIGDEFEATVSGVAPHGVYCAFDSPFVEALCHVTALGNDFYELDAHGLRLVGRRSGASYGLGDKITVRLESVNLAERAILVSPVIYAHRDDEYAARFGAGGPLGGDAPPKRKTDKRRGAESSRPAAKGARTTGRRAESPKPESLQSEETKRARRRERRSKDERKAEKRKRK